MRLVILLSTFSVVLPSCQAQEPQSSHDYSQITHIATPAADYPEQYLHLIQDQRVALVVNHTSRVRGQHLVDFLKSRGVHVVKIFAPEHGYRGKADAGAQLDDEELDQIPVISLYGKKKKPSASDLEGVDIVVFDIQDVGVRFYTYLSTLHYVMEASAESDIPVIVLDRPNPHANYIDGPVLDMAFSSFVGLHPVPIVYGMTIGEYARMINGEGWLAHGIACDLQVIACPGYQRHLEYILPVKPSPNLPTQNSILLYPSLCLYEGTVVSVGRGTEHPFEVYGHPDFYTRSYVFTPEPTAGASHPKLEGIECNGRRLRARVDYAPDAKRSLLLSHLLTSYAELDLGESFFTKGLFFDKLAGTDQLRKQLMAGASENEIRTSWSDELADFAVLRSRYLLYP